MDVNIIRRTLCKAYFQVSLKADSICANSFAFKKVKKSLNKVLVMNVNVGLGPAFRRKSTSKQQLFPV